MILLNEVVGIAKSILGKVITDKDKKIEIESQIDALALNGQLDSETKRMALITAEATSSDKFVRRARPGFLWIMLIMILMGIPMGILSAFNPCIAADIATGMRAWLTAIPREMWGLFGVGYLGYSAARSYDKKKNL